MYRTELCIKREFKMGLIDNICLDLSISNKAVINYMAFRQLCIVQYNAMPSIPSPLYCIALHCILFIPIALYCIITKNLVRLPGPHQWGIFLSVRPIWLKGNISSWEWGEQFHIMILSFDEYFDIILWWIFWYYLLVHIFACFKRSQRFWVAALFVCAPSLKVRPHISSHIL